MRQLFKSRSFLGFLVAIIASVVLGMSFVLIMQYLIFDTIDLSRWSFAHWALTFLLALGFFSCAKMPLIKDNPED